MKFQILRRAGALVLALVLAMTLAVPAWAAGDGDDGTDPPGTETTPGTDEEGGGGDTVPVTGVTVSPKTLALTEGESKPLTATVAPDNATDKAVTWSSNIPSIAEVSADGTVTAKAVGTTTITATTKDGNKTDTCLVTVSAKPAPRLVLDGAASITVDPGKLTLTAILYNVPEGATVSWNVEFKSAQRQTTLPDYDKQTKGELSETGDAVIATTTLNSSDSGPGEFIVTASYGNLPPDTKTVTISGLVLSAPTKELGGTKWSEKSMEMLVNESAALTVDIFGDADDSGETTLSWESSAPSTVSVPYNGGNLLARQLGEATITAEKGKYSVECVVKVVEDEDVIAGPYPASASSPLILRDVYTELNSISVKKTEVGLSYITNLFVRTNQGTLYYNYSTESDTGDGVGETDQFARVASGAIKSLDRLYFVPKPGFTGTAEITFNGVSEKGNFAGVIKVEVGTGSSGGTYQISYRARAGEPAWFLTDDFVAFCRSETGRSFNYITFTLPRSNEGVLYYDYMAGSGNPVSTTIQFTPSGQYSVDDVCFVPNPAFSGTVTINFRAVDTSNETVDGTVTVNVTASSAAAEPSTVVASGERGQPVTLLGSSFNDACQEILNDTLSFVIFKLPDPKEGTLYYNYRSDGSYESRVAASARYYYSGVPGLSSVTFVPASNAAGQVVIPYTGYSVGGASFSGTLYISLGEVNRSTIYYYVMKGGSISFSAADFYNAALYQTGTGVTSVRFTDEFNNYYYHDFGDLGTLRYNYRSSSSPGSVVSSGTSYYYSSNYSQRLSLISFHAGNTAGIVTIPYKAVCGTGSSAKEFTGTVVIQVGSLTPADINLSCSAGRYAQLSASTVNYVCGAVMNGSLSYIEITNIPSPEEGRLYLNYNGFGTGTEVKQGDRLYYLGSPNIGQLTFVPHARFTGESEITYIGCSTDGLEQVSGRIMVNVYNSASSSYFSDMGAHTWAIDSVDYLYWNGTVKGAGERRFEPGGIITRGDFVLMLVRAYGFTAAGSASFDDVPADSYYADAIRIAYQLDIVNGSNGNFYPKDPLSRQDAMVMIYRALRVSGKTTTNGLAADLSGYRDENLISTYAREIMGNLVQMGVVKGNGGGYLEPLRQLTRAEAAVLLHTIMTL